LVLYKEKKFYLAQSSGSSKVWHGYLHSSGEDLMMERITTIAVHKEEAT
jgi:hypothetical protein